MADDLWDAVKAAAKATGCSAAEYVRRCVRAHLARQAGDAKPEEG